MVESIPLDTLSELNVISPENKAAMPVSAIPPKPDQELVDAIEITEQPVSDAGESVNKVNCEPASKDCSQDVQPNKE